LNKIPKSFYEIITQRNIASMKMLMFPSSRCWKDHFGLEENCIITLPLLGVWQYGADWCCNCWNDMYVL